MAPETIQNDPPRRLLAIDGGGLLGLIPAEALILVEEQLNVATLPFLSMLLVFELGVECDRAPFLSLEDPIHVEDTSTCALDRRVRATVGEHPATQTMNACAMITL